MWPPRTLPLGVHDEMGRVGAPREKPRPWFRERAVCQFAAPLVWGRPGRGFARLGRRFSGRAGAAGDALSDEKGANAATRQARTSEAC